MTYGKANASELKSKARIEWIDIAKGIAILFVIVGHTLTSGETAWKAVFSFHMPLFFILAGVTFRPKEWGTLVQSSAKRLLLPFILMFVLLSITSNPGIFLHPTDFFSSLVYSLAYQPKQLPWHVDIAYVGAIWFLLCMFVARLYLNAIVRLFERFSLHIAFQIVIVAALGYCGAIIGRYVLVPFVLDIALVAMMFMYIGWLFKTYELEKVLTNWKAIVIAAPLWLVCFLNSALEMGARDYTMFPLAVIAACAGSLICIKTAMAIDALPKWNVTIGKPIKQYFTYMGKNSMTVFCIHCFEYCVIDWRQLPFVSGLPFSGLFAGVVRVAFVSLAMFLFGLL